jgi:TonB family protein
VVLSLVVDSSGTPKNVRIVTPLGLGLDENAVSAVNSWKFKPALRGSTPVPVQIMVEVDFHLF